MIALLSRQPGISPAFSLGSLGARFFENTTLAAPCTAVRPRRGYEVRRRRLDLIAIAAAFGERMDAWWLWCRSRQARASAAECLAVVWLLQPASLGSLHGNLLCRGRFGIPGRMSGQGFPVRPLPLRPVLASLPASSLLGRLDPGLAPAAAKTLATIEPATILAAIVLADELEQKLRPVRAPDLGRPGGQSVARQACRNSSPRRKGRLTITAMPRSRARGRMRCSTSRSGTL